ncbi:hypothetical protein SNE35_31470 [Paucibacter sp. R3-3]|uniref:Uncharacterized protein n=2 Tax=Roseateles agri TaxID=3098619 RepID=A0ABU5DRW2_9BURK|nr:hypothetical protein [Paucibacter sp. R3-3]
MLRFIDWLDELPGLHNAAALNVALTRMLKRFDADEGRIEARFSFLLREDLATCEDSDAARLDFEGRWVAECAKGRTTIWAEVKVPDPVPCLGTSCIRTQVARTRNSSIATKAGHGHDVEWRDLLRKLGRSVERDARIGRYSIDVVRVHAQPSGLREHRTVINQRQLE